MRILASWLRQMVGDSSRLPKDDQQLADELTLIGIAVEGIDRSGRETVFEMEITTNRVDAMNHYGIARECSALYDVDLKPLEIASACVDTSAPKGLSVEINEAALCARFSAIVLRDVRVGQSSGAVAERLPLLGQRLINSAADATNYVLFEMGKPTHVYDLDKLAGGKLLVRRAKKGETLKTLDGVERKLTEDDLVIADAEKPVGLAGVMGGEDTKVTEATRNIAIESAWFDPAIVRNMSRRQGLHTDASHRFERGADIGTTSLAASRVGELIMQRGGGKQDGGVIDVVAGSVEIPPIELRLQQVRRILGKEIAEQEIARILRRLGFLLESAGGGAYRVTVPTWRLDVSREIDLIEEIARVHGFNKFENTLPSFSGGVVELATQEKEQKLRSTLLALGYNEAISSTFESRADAERLTAKQKHVALSNPLSDERALMRSSLLSGMLDMVEYNLNRDQLEVRLFEIGNVFRSEGVDAVQAPQACFAMSTPTDASDWPRSSFYHLKGGLDLLLSAYHGVIEYVNGAPEYFHPGRSAVARSNGQVVAALGEVAHGAYGARKLRQPVHACEIYLDRLFAAPLRTARYKQLSRFPAVERDFSLLLPNGVSWQQIRDAIAKLDIAELREFRIIEIFRGKSVPAGQYSALLRATMQSFERTLRDEEVSGWSERIVSALQAMGGTLRAS